LKVSEQLRVDLNLAKNAHSVDMSSSQVNAQRWKEELEESLNQVTLAHAQIDELNGTVEDLQDELCKARDAGIEAIDEVSFVASNLA